MKPSSLLVIACLAVGACSSGDARRQKPPSEKDAVQLLSYDTLFVFGGGEVAQDPLYRVKSASLSNRRLAVANAGGSQVLVLDSTGRPVAKFGRVGSGPGEFRSLATVWWRGDTVVAYDIALAKLEYFLPTQMQPVRTYTLRGDGKLVAAALDDGRLLGIVIEPRPVPPPGAQSIDTASIVLLDQVQGTTELLKRLQWRIRYGARLPTGQILGLTLPLEPQGKVTVAGRWVYLGESTNGNLLRYQADGQIDTLRTELPVRRFTAAMAERWQEDMFAAAAQQTPEFRQYLRSLPYPDVLPAFDIITGSANGGVWLREFPVPGAPMVRWHAYDIAGTRVGSLELGVYETILSAADNLIVTVRNSLDQPETIRAYRLR